MGAQVQDTPKAHALSVSSAGIALSGESEGTGLAHHGLAAGPARPSRLPWLHLNEAVEGVEASHIPEQDIWVRLGIEHPLHQGPGTKVIAVGELRQQRQQREQSSAQFEGPCASGGEGTGR